MAPVNSTTFNAPDDAPVLVAVMNDPRDLVRAREQGWYRIPLSHTPSRVAADVLAFYQTGAFPPDERWTVRWFAPVRGYHLTSRRELIPEEPDHPRADDRYYRIDVGSLERLPHPIVSRRLRRIAFIRTTMSRLLAAREINDLWIRTPAQERLWQAFRQAGLDADTEHAYPLVDDQPFTADFAIFCDRGRIAVLVTGDVQADIHVREATSLDYLLARGNWHVISIDRVDSEAIASCLMQIRALAST
jgi:hypothetical protein